MTAYTPNLPALITALLGDATRAPQELGAAASTPAGCCSRCAAALPGAEPVPTSAEGRLFTRARQVLFLETLPVTGSVRLAGRAGEGGGGFRRRSVLVSTSCQLRGLARRVHVAARPDRAPPFEV